jgi:hypothetical protein
MAFGSKSEWGVRQNQIETLAGRTSQRVISEQADRIFNAIHSNVYLR